MHSAFLIASASLFLSSFAGSFRISPSTAFVRSLCRSHANVYTSRSATVQSVRFCCSPSKRREEATSFMPQPSTASSMVPHEVKASPTKGPVSRVGGTVMNTVKKVGVFGLTFLSVILLSGLPVVANAATSTLADLSVTATSSFNSITAKLAASGFLQAFSLVFVSELGDKTFFIAGLLAMKTSRLISFSGSMAALSVMTVISVVIGQIFHAIPSNLAGGVKIDQWVAVMAFAYFGLKTLKESYEMPEGDMSGMEEEKAEAEKAVQESSAPEQKTPWGSVLQIFSLVFAAEFGDRSFLSTIALGAAQNPFSVATGAIGAHATATGIAVASGAFLSKYLSEKVIGYIGGALFVIFAITTAFGVF